MFSSGISDFSNATNSDMSWFPKEKMSIGKAAEVVKVIKDALVLK